MVKSIVLKSDHVTLLKQLGTEHRKGQVFFSFVSIVWIILTIVYPCKRIIIVSNCPAYIWSRIIIAFEWNPCDHYFYTYDMIFG